MHWGYQRSEYIDDVKGLLMDIKQWGNYTTRAIVEVNVKLLISN